MSVITVSPNNSFAALWWRESGILTSPPPQTNNAMAIYNISSSSVSRAVMPYSGQVLGFFYGMNAAITAGTFDVELFINNVEVIQTTMTSATAATEKVLYTTPQSFAAGQTVDYRYSCDAALLTLDTFLVTAIIRFD